ncbi:capsular polysaccharide biosynthesis protein [Clostridium sartagoforme AAU1]|uniref:Capsular polysaccharide biosynthesis protein n=1 Tax=Clostridium sartagoforme AAU1 TaxID=1202534 RepID=R9C5K3_9CLOT|nr:sugar transferase [Clostridium sartagoforme]EOR24563.1 capsular polysaccharide biosynthesis protein [Clostridium sartagoforme AAU1]
MDNINTSNQQIEITYKATNKVGYNAVKRLADIVLSLISIVLLSPIFIIVAIVIRFDSKGKIVFGQNRIGKDMKEFRIYKFRTMYENSEEIFKISQRNKKMSII